MGRLTPPRPPRRGPERGPDSESSGRSAGPGPPSPLAPLIRSAGARRRAACRTNATDVVPSCGGGEIVAKMPCLCDDSASPASPTMPLVPHSAGPRCLRSSGRTQPWCVHVRRCVAYAHVGGRDHRVDGLLCRRFLLGRTGPESTTRRSSARTKSQHGLLPQPDGGTLVHDRASRGVDVGSSRYDSCHRGSCVDRPKPMSSARPHRCPMTPRTCTRQHPPTP